MRLALGVAHHHAAQQHVERVERVLLPSLPGRADDVTPKAIFVPGAKGRDAQEVELALKIIDLVVQGCAAHHPPARRVQPLALARELCGGGAHLLHLVEHHPTPRDRTQCARALVERAVRAHHDVVLSELRRRRAPQPGGIPADQIRVRILGHTQR